jgi:beta-lactamase regulating signal transducer with metallopeptidase domain
MSLPGLDAVFALTWRASLRACVLIVAVLIVQALAGKRLPARFRYALSLLVLLRLLVPVTPASRLSMDYFSRHFQPAPAAAPILLPAAHPEAMAELPASQLPIGPSRPPRLSLRPLAAEIWLCGCGGVLLAVLWRHRKFGRWVAQLPTADDPRLIELVEQCKREAGLRRAARIARAPEANTAAVFGFRPPCLLLPEGLLDTLERREARLVILHELLHIRRRDVLVNWISVLALAPHWFNPLAWLAMRRLRADQELACDAAVLGLLEPAERGAYGRTLLKQLQGFPAARLAAGLVPLITFRHNIKRRIIMITEFNRAGGLARGLFALLFVALGGLTFTRAADDAKPAATNTGTITGDMLSSWLDADDAKPAATNTGPPAAALDQFRDTSSVTALPKAGQDYGAEYVKQSTLLEQLEAMDGGNHSRFIQALSVTASDPILNSLLEQELAQETKLTSLKIRYGKQMPEMQEAAAVIADLKEKIDQRANGILAGMSVQIAALKAAANEGLRRAPANGAIESKSLEDWDHQRVMAEADYLEYSNILHNLEALPTDRLGPALATAYTHRMDPELAELASRLETAKERMVAAEHDYGPKMPAYVTAQKQLEECHRAYQNKIEGIMTGLRTRVKMDEGYLEIIRRQETNITEAMDRKKAEKGERLY